MARLPRVTIVGLGLIGGSLGLALKRRHLAREVVGVSRRSATLRLAKQRRAIDWGTTDAARAVRKADVVVLATPVGAIVPTAVRLAPFMRRGSILTDVGSTKAAIVRALERRLPDGIAFVGAHPLAGSERRGFAAAQADLFDDSLCILTKTAKTSPTALSRVTRFWAALVSPEARGGKSRRGMRRVVVMAPATHDRVLAQVSHLPHVLAFCLAQAASPRARRLSPRSFLDATRVAKSDPALWRDILLSNQAALLAAMNRFDRGWTTARRLLRRRSPRALQQFLRHGQRLRQRLQD